MAAKLAVLGVALIALAISAIGLWLLFRMERSR